MQTLWVNQCLTSWAFIYSGAIPTTLACEIMKDITVLSRSSSSLCHPKWLRDTFQSPGLKHMLQVGVWVYIFPRTLFPSC